MNADLGMIGRVPQVSEYRDLWHPARRGEVDEMTEAIDARLTLAGEK